MTRATNLAKINPELDELEVSQADLNFSGRQSNKALGDFRLWGKSKHQQYFNEYNGFIRLQDYPPKQCLKQNQSYPWPDSQL